MSRYNITAQQNKPYLLPKQMVNQFEGTDEEKAAFNFAINQMDYIMAESFCEQIGVLCSHLRNPPLKVSYERIGKLFDESRHLIWDMEKNYIRGPGVDGRPCTLNDNELNILRGLINQLLYNPAFRIYPTFAEISDLIYTNFKKYISQDTLRHLFYTKFSDDYKTCIGVPMDKDRVEASLIDIETNLMQLSQKVSGVPAPFVFNVDEMGQSDFADAHETVVIVPKNFSKPRAEYSVDRSIKTATCLACINLNGIGCKPQYTVQRKTIETDLYDHLPYESLQVVHTDSGYVNTQSFLFWMNTCFLPNLRRLRIQYQYFGRAVLILDGYKSHKNALGQINLTLHNLSIHFLSAHTSDQSQPLDLGIFGCMKQIQSNFRANPELTKVCNQIIKIHKSLYQVANPINCRSAFRQIGIITTLYLNFAQFPELVTFDLIQIKRIRFYEESYLNQLFRSRMPMTNNQMMLYNFYQKNKNKNKKKQKTTITLTYFPSPKKK